ncbi:MAG TPA: Fic family protein [Candidatus Saccharimonadales bacterium]|nr:Fic family protein [Candidatus Saccharimonadales bacterium]
MLYQTPVLPPTYIQIIENIEDCRNKLRFSISDNLNRWNGFLARMAYARAIHGSNTMEGVNATLDDALAAVDGDIPSNPQDENWLALTGHRDAMDYIIQLSKEPSFEHNEGTLLSLHFMMMKHELAKNPGRYRPGPVHVTNMSSGRTVYEAPNAELVPALVRELVENMKQKNSQPVLVRAAMAHLNLTMIHPFRDGNGRMARALQTFVLAREGILDPRFSSIEEYVGRNSSDYYAVLAEVGKGEWHPENDALPWIKFCLTAHHFQAQTLLKRIGEVGSLWERLEQLTKELKIPSRTIGALMDAATGRRVRNPVYRRESDVSAQIAKRDLKILVTNGLLEAKGEKRGRYYIASKSLSGLYEQSKVDRPIRDPFLTLEEEAQSAQLNLV